MTVAVPIASGILIALVVIGVGESIGSFSASHRRSCAGAAEVKAWRNIPTTGEEAPPNSQLEPRPVEP